MTPFSKKAAAILDTLTKGLDNPGDSCKFDRNPDAYMALSVECIGHNLYSLAHYFEQNGDLVCDPDGVFFRSEIGTWHPVSVQYATGTYIRVMELDGRGQPSKWNPRGYRDLKSFMTTWLTNIKHQQL